LRADEHYDLDRAPGKGRKPDIRLKGEGVMFSLMGVNGAILTAPNSAQYSAELVRIDGLGVGCDIFVRTSEGRRSHVFLMSEVEPSSSEVRLYFVTIR
jgi:hypothetical protein